MKKIRRAERQERNRKEGRKKEKKEERKVNDNSEKKREKEATLQKYVCTHFSEALISYFLCVILSVCVSVPLSVCLSLSFCLCICMYVYANTYYIILTLSFPSFFSSSLCVPCITPILYRCALNFVILTSASSASLGFELKTYHTCVPLLNIVI